MYRPANAILLAVLVLGALLMTGLLSGAVGCAGLTRGRSVETRVEAEGWAPQDPRDPLGSRRRALADAQRRAVESACGVAVSAVTRVEDAAASRDRVAAAARGFVSRYEVVREGVQDGFWKVLIRAWVKPDGPSPASAPPSGTHLSLALLGPAAAAVRRELLAQGFQVSEDSASIRLQGEAGTVALRDARLGPLRSSRARVSLRALDSRTGAVVWERTQEAAAVDLDAEGAASKASEAAGALLGRRAAAELADLLWRSW